MADDAEQTGEPGESGSVEPRPADREGGKDRKDHKPISVRDAVGPPGLRGQKPRPRGRSRGRTAGPDSRPTPVREAMEAPAVEEVLADPESLPSREIEIGGDAWIVREAGRTRGGHAGDRGAPLVELVFFRAETPEIPARSVLAVGSVLDELSTERVEEAFRRSRAIAEERRPRA